MARDATSKPPPHVQAHIDQAAAHQREEDTPPDDVLLQLRIRAADLGPEEAGVVVSVTTALDNSVQAVACLEAVMASADEFAVDVIKTMNALMDHHGDDPDVRNEVTVALAMYARLMARLGRR